MTLDLQLTFGLIEFDELTEWSLGMASSTDHLDRPRSSLHAAGIEQARDFQWMKLPLLTGRHLRQACRTLSETWPCYIPPEPPAPAGPLSAGF